MKFLMKALLVLFGISNVVFAHVEQVNFSFSNPVNLYFYQNKISGRMFEVLNKELKTTENTVSLTINKKYQDDHIVHFVNENILKTSIEGIGVIVLLNNKNIYQISEEELKNITVSNNHLTLTAKLVTYSDQIQSGKFLSEAIQVGSINDGTRKVDILVQPINVLIKPKSCEINPNSIHQTVNLRKIVQSDIPTKGSETFGGQFNIGLTCDENVIVTSVIKDNSDPDNMTNVLSLDKHRSTATGVGIRLYRAEQPIQLKTEWEFSRNLRQPNVLFTAKYVNTEGKVTPGSVNATAIVSFSYR
ncbi:fimbrial protein [Bisgaard Taxon 46]